MSNNIISDIKDATKSFIDDRLKNPYITTVIAVWLFTNRVVVFGIFNFEDGLTLNDRIIWVSRNLRKFDIWIFEGIFGGILYAFLLGIISMILFSLATGGGKAIYKWINKYSIELLHWVDESDWISIKEFEKIYETNEALSKNNKELKKEIEGLENDLKLKNEQLMTLRNSVSEEQIIQPETTSRNIKKEETIIQKILNKGYRDNFEKILTKIGKGEWLNNDNVVDYLISLNVIDHIQTSSDRLRGEYRLSPIGMNVKDYYAINYMV